VRFAPDLAYSLYGHLSKWYKVRMTGIEGALRPEKHEKPGTKVFRDPIHDLIYLGPEDRWILDLIDTKEFQRLRRIRQLGLAHFAYRVTCPQFMYQPL